MTGEEQTTEAQRLERLWASGFGDAYVDRNRAFDQREPFWHDRLAAMPTTRVLEVGCNIGGNLQWIARDVPAPRVIGVDINEKVLSVLRHRVPGVQAVRTSARALPFRSGRFDLVFTMGVLIHQPEASLRDVMAEVVRTSRHWILCGEYHAPATVDVPYRGEQGALFKRDYGSLFLDWFPELCAHEQGFLGRAAGWDDVTWWSFKKAGS